MMDGTRARRKGLGACRTLLLLLLLWGATATALALEGGSASQDGMLMQEVAEIKKNNLLTFLAWWHEWTSQSSTGGLARGNREVATRQEVAPLQQPPRRDKARCKNFFWKTFSCR